MTTAEQDTLQKIGCLGAARITSSAICGPVGVVGGSKLHAVAARDMARSEAFAQAHGFLQCYDDYSELINDERVTLIYNPLPINLHAEWTIRALRAKKHVLCEKPFAMNLAEAEQVAAVAKANNRRVIEAFHYRYHPAFIALLDWVREGRIGAVRLVNAKFTVPIGDKGGSEIRHLPETGGGAFMDLGCYPLHWARQIIGLEPVEVKASAVCTSRGVDESLTAKLGFADGTEAHAFASIALDQPMKPWLEVVGQNGRIVFDNPLLLNMEASLVLETRTEKKSLPISAISTYTYQLAAVVEGLKNGTPLPTEAGDFIGQQRSIDAIYAAAGLAHLREM